MPSTATLLLDGNATLSLQNASSERTISVEERLCCVLVGRKVKHFSNRFCRSVPFIIEIVLMDKVLYIECEMK